MEKMISMQSVNEGDINLGKTREGSGSASVHVNEVWFVFLDGSSNPSTPQDPTLVREQIYAKKIDAIPDRFMVYV
jgi:hypothetical protein